MLNIEIKTIPDKDQRYNTVGDYYTTPEGKRVFAVSDMNNWKHEFLITLHELVESALCKEKGITDEAIDAFDIAYETNRTAGDIDSEPGDDANAPYHHQHVFATKIEKMMAEELDVEWETYSKACADLTKED